MITISIDPVAFYLGPIEVRWYGIIVALAVLSLALWMWRRITANKDRIPPVDPTVAIPAVASGFGMAKLFHVIDGWDYYSQNLGQIIGGSGLTIYGAVLGAALGIWVYSKVSKFPFGYFTDVTAPGIILAQAVGRVGCILNGCCYGVETTAFCAIVYTHPESLAPIGVPVHPTQIYEIIYNLIVFSVLLILRGRFKPDGSLFLIYLSLYSLWRFGISFLRDGSPFLFGLQQAQVIALIILAIAIPLLAVRTRWVKKEKEGEAE